MSFFDTLKAEENITVSLDIKKSIYNAFLEKVGQTNVKDTINQLITDFVYKDSIVTSKETSFSEHNRGHKERKDNARALANQNGFSEYPFTIAYAKWNGPQKYNMNVDSKNISKN